MLLHKSNPDHVILRIRAMDDRYLIDVNGEVANAILETIKDTAPFSFEPLFEKDNEVETEATPQSKQEVSEVLVQQQEQVSAQALQP
jgi:hypothetical protein